MLEDGIRRWNPWWAEAENLNELSGMERDITPYIVEAINLRHIKDIIGVRRAGKTTIIYQLIKSLINGKIKVKDIVFLNFDDIEINASSFEDILKALAKINPDIKYLFVDEIQQKHGWETWIRVLYDTMAFKQIFVSGSSASLLSKEMGRFLTGRHLTFSVFPLSFGEYMKFVGRAPDFKIASRAESAFHKEDFLDYNKNKLLYYQEEYIKGGGFPETAGKTHSQKGMILTNVYNDILSRDITARFGVSYDIVKKISYHLLSNIGNEFSYRSIADATGLSAETAEKYLEFLKESFMIMTLDFFSYKTKMQFKQNKKAYCIDTGLRNFTSFAFSQDIGRLAENVVFVELKRRGKEVYYWKDKKGKEVDFLIKEGTEIKELIQVCWNIDSDKTKKRELDGLLTACNEFRLEEGVIITEDFEAEETVEKKKIKFVPLWKWLLYIPPFQ